MLYGLGRVYGPNNPPGYDIDPSDLETISRRIIGAPVTFEHAGITEAIKAPAVRDGLSTLGKVVPFKGIFGTVLEMFQVGPFWYVVFSLTPTVSWLVVRRHLRGLSMTHLTPDVPLEITLTKSPARPTCFIECVGSLDLILSYKRTVLQSSEFVMSHLEDILAKMEPADREAVTARLSLISGKLSAVEADLANKATEVETLTERAAAAEASLESANESLKTASLVAASEEARLRGEISTLKAHIDPEILSNCSLSDAALEGLFSSDPTMSRRVFDRVLVAANTQMMNLKNGTAPTKKRKREPEMTTPLQRALADTFECQ